MSMYMYIHPIHLCTHINIQVCNMNGINKNSKRRMVNFCPINVTVGNAITAET